MRQSKIRLVICILVTILLFSSGIGVGILLYSRVGEKRSEKEEVIPEKTLISQETYARLAELKRLVDYAIQRYCDDTGKENTYVYHIIENMMHHDTLIRDNDRYIFDLDKIVSEELLGDKYTYQVPGRDDLIYVVVNTYRMKIYVYESESNPHIVAGDDGEWNVFDSELETLVQGDWSDMWPWEYTQFVFDGYEYLTTPDTHDKFAINEKVYGMVTYSLQRYCEENDIEEMFYFELPEDYLTHVNRKILTVKVESENRILYMDIDRERNKVHIYQVQEDEY